MKTRKKTEKTPVSARPKFLWIIDDELETCFYSPTPPKLSSFSFEWSLGKNQSKNENK